MHALKYFFTVLCCLVGNLAFAQGVEIRGTVTDTDRKPIPFATVRVVGTATGAITDDDGKYSFITRMSDTITVAFSCIGYESRERSIYDVNDERGYVLNCQLHKNTQNLKEVEVTEYKAQTNAMQSFNSEHLKGARGASGASVEELLATLPGVVTPSELSSQYNVRGGSYDENAVYINGTEIYRPQLVATGQQEGLSVINSDMVDKINFSSGGFSSEYDDKMSSVLDISYRRPLPFEASLTAGLMGVNATLGQSSTKFSQLHGFRFRKNSSLLSKLDEKGEYDPTFLDYQLNLVYTPSDRWIFRASANIAVNDYKFTPTTRETSFGTIDEVHQLKVYFDGYEKDRYENWQGALALGYKFSDKAGIGLNLSGAWLNELVTQDISSEYWIDVEDNSSQTQIGIGRSIEHVRQRLDIKVFDAELKGNLGLNNHNLTYGVAMKAMRIKERSNEWEARDSAGYNQSPSSALEVWYSLSSRQNLSTMKLSAFVQDAWKVALPENGLLSINAGIRFSYLDFNKEFLVSPKLYLTWKPGKYNDWLFRFSAGLYHQTPFYKEYRNYSVNESGEYFIELNRNIKAQRSLQFSLGADRTFHWGNRPFKLSAEAYLKSISNYIPYQIDNMKIVYAGRNLGKATIAGLDLKFFGQFVPGADSWISVGVMSANQTVEGIRSPMPSDRRYNLGIYFTDFFPKIPRLKFFLKGIFNDGIPVSAPGTYGDAGYFRMPAYKRVDIGLSYALVNPLKEGETRTGVHKIFRSAWIGFDIFNLFDMQNIAGYYWVADISSKQYAVPNYLTGRQFNVTVSLEF